MVKFLMILVAGGVGSFLRYLVAGWAQSFGNDSFPLGTLIVNSVGCLLIGVFGALFAGPHLVREEYRTALLVGLLGGFTTFSTFGWETFALARDGELRLALANVVLSNALGLVAIWFGYRITEKCIGV
jgi:CrcB protein